MFVGNIFGQVIECAIFVFAVFAAELNLVVFNPTGINYIDVQSRLFPHLGQNLNSNIAITLKLSKNQILQLVLNAEHLEVSHRQALCDLERLL